MRMTAAVVLIALACLAACTQPAATPAPAARPPSASAAPAPAETPVPSGESAMTAKPDKLPRTDAEWKKVLTPEQYRVMREKG